MPPHTHLFFEDTRRGGPRRGASQGLHPQQSHPGMCNKRNMAWQYDIPPGATAGDAAERHKVNGQSIRNVRKKVKGAGKSEEPARESLSLYAHCLRAFAVGRLAWDRSESRRKEPSPRKYAELSCLLRTEKPETPRR